MPGRPIEQRRYHRVAMMCWYECERNFKDAAAKLPAYFAEKHIRQKPVTEETLRIWANRFGWRAEADQLDADAMQAVMKRTAERRAEMLLRHANNGRMLQSLAFRFFSPYLDPKNPKYTQDAFDTPFRAMKGLEAGMKMERQAEGLPDWMIQLQGMSDDELIRLYAQQTQGATRTEDGDGATWDAATSDEFDEDTD